MTPERRAEIEALLLGLTDDGDWEHIAGEYDGVAVVHGRTEPVARFVWCYPECSIQLYSSDAQVIAAAPTIIRELLTDVDRLTSGIRAFADANVYGPHTDYKRTRDLYALVGIDLVWDEDQNGPLASD